MGTSSPSEYLTLKHTVDTGESSSNVSMMPSRPWAAATARARCPARI